ncbi:MAG: type I-E CRISPR-associated protein Cas6/Cse3/CasE [bacterium]
MIFLSRLLLDPRSKAVRRDMADCQELHRTVMAAFPQVATLQQLPRASFRVLYRLEWSLRSERVKLYVQSKTQPDWTHLPPGHLTAEDGLENPACKTIDESYRRLTEGMRLRFRLRANPTKKVDTKTGPNGLRRNGRRVELRRDEEQIDWLRRKAEHGGFRILDVAAAPEVPCVRLIREGLSHARKAGQTLTFASVLFDGRLEVTDAPAFAEALEAGIGPGKAYGFGLLSLAPDPD